MSEREKLYNLLKETSLLLNDGDRRLFGQYDLSPSRFYALFHVNEKPGLSASELSDRLLCDKSNVTRIVKGLEKMNYIRRQPHETDGRTRRLYLTEKGQAIYNDVHAAHQAYNETRLNNIDGTAQNILLENLSTLNIVLQTALKEQTQSDNRTAS